MREMIIPLSEMTEAKRTALHTAAFKAMKAQGLKLIKGVSEGDLIVRELVIGDEANAADFVDLNVRTAVATGQQEWAQDANDLTDRTLSSVLASGETVPDEKVIGVYGFIDLTPNPDLVMLRFKKGSEVKDIWQVEHCYGKEPYGGINVDENGNLKLIVWQPNDPIDWEMCFKDGSVDKYVRLFALIAEKVGERVTVKR